MLSLRQLFKIVDWAAIFLTNQNWFEIRSSSDEAFIDEAETPLMTRMQNRSLQESKQKCCSGTHAVLINSSAGRIYCSCLGCIYRLGSWPENLSQTKGVRQTFYASLKCLNVSNSRYHSEKQHGTIQLHNRYEAPVICDRDGVFSRSIWR